MGKVDVVVPQHSDYVPPPTKILSGDCIALPMWNESMFNLSRPRPKLRRDR